MKYKFLATIALLSLISSALAQNSNNIAYGQVPAKNTLGINIGTAALEAIFDDSGFNFEVYYQRQLNKTLFWGVDQGFIIQDNFPANYYTTNTAPFHLAPEIDSYIRSLSWEQAVNFAWTKSTIVFLVPYIGLNLLHYKLFSLGLKTGIGVQYRNYVRFGLLNFVTDQSGQIVDYKEKITVNSAVTPVLNLAINMSQALVPTVALNLNIGYTYELADKGNLKNIGPGDYITLQIGVRKSF